MKSDNAILKHDISSVYHNTKIWMLIDTNELIQEQKTISDSWAILLIKESWISFRKEDNLQGLNQKPVLAKFQNRSQKVAICNHKSQINSKEL